MSSTNETKVPASQVRLLTAARKFRVLEVEAKKSKEKGNPMFEMTVELIDHPPVPQQDGTSVDINGLEFMYWVTLTPSALFGVNRFHKAIGFPQVTEADLPNLTKDSYKGQVFWALSRSESVEKLDENKQVIINPLTGKPMIQWNRKITELITAD